MLSVYVALPVVGATDDDGMSVSHVLGNEVAGHGYPVRAVLASTFLYSNLH